MTLRGFLLWLLGALAAWPLAAAGRTYRVATTPWMGWTYLDVAEAKGFWKAEGLSIDVQRFPDGATYLDALLSRKVEFSCCMIGDAVWIHTHASPVQILLETGWSVGGDRFLVRKGRTLAELAGRPVGVYQGTYALPFFLKKALGSEYRHLAASTFVHMSPLDLVAQIQAGRLDMAVLYDPFAQTVAPLTRMAASSDRPAGCIPEGLFAFRETLDDIPSRDVDAFLRGILKALAWMADPANDAELLGIVNRRSFQSQPLASLSELRAQKRGAPTHTRAKLEARNMRGGGLTQFLQELQGFVRTHEPKAPLFKPGDLFDPALLTRNLER